MRKIRRRKNYTNYIIIACICIFSVMGIGYGYLQQSLDINLRLSKKAIDITDNVVSSGDGLYEDQYETGRYVYRGSEPNNYIMFNDELWRIIAKEADGTYKIIRDGCYQIEHTIPLIIEQPQKIRIVTTHLLDVVCMEEYRGHTL